MIFPSNRLLFWCAFGFTPLFGTAVLVGGNLWIAILVIPFLLVLADALAGRLRPRKIQLLPRDPVRLSVDHHGEFTLHFSKPEEAEHTVRVGLALPVWLHCDQNPMEVRLPAGAAAWRLEFPVLPLRRGRFLLDGVWLEAPTPLGFWTWRLRLPGTIEFRIHPNLKKERAAALFLSRGVTGIHTVRQVGKGREFEKLRDYLPGDGFEDIHWKTTAKRGRPVTKTFQMERTQEVLVALDASRLSGRPVGRALSEELDIGDAPQEWVGRRNMLERAVTAGLLLGVAAERQGDRMGLLGFDDRVRRFVSPGSGPAHFHACREALLGFEPKRVSPDFEELAAFVTTRLRRRALLVILTSLDDPVLSEQFVSVAGMLARRHLVLVQMLAPSGERPLFQGNAPTSLRGIHEALAGHERWAGLRETESALAKEGVRFQLVDSERAGVALLTHYMTVKRRQLL